MRLLYTVLKNLFFLIIISVTHGTPSSSPGEYTRGDKDKKKKTLKITHLFRQVVESQLESAIGSDNRYSFKPHKFKLVL